jgi:hypothetical protein
LIDFKPIFLSTPIQGRDVVHRQVFDSFAVLDGQSLGDPHHTLRPVHPDGSKDVEGNGSQKAYCERRAAMDRVGWTISIIAILVTLAIAFDIERRSRKRRGNGGARGDR